MMLKKILPAMATLLLLANSLFSQEIINQGFEMNTGVVGTNYMYQSVDSFEAKVPNCYSGGNFPNLDLISQFPINGFTAYSGDWFVGVTPVDLLTLELSSPLVAGNSYTITFFDMTKDNFSSPVEIGVSNHAYSFGDLVYTSPQIPSIFQWQMRTFTFTAPGNATFISVRQQWGEDSRLWLGIDQLTLDANHPCNKILLLGPDQVMCPNVPIVLSANDPNFDSFLWNDGSSGISNEISQPGTYWVTARYDTCTASDTVIVSPGESPDVNFSADITSGCTPLNVIFSYTGTAQPNAVFSWNFGDGSPNSGLPSTGNVYTIADCHDVSLTVTSEDLCQTTLTKNEYICVHPLPSAVFETTPDHIFVDHPQVNFVNTSAGNITNDWNFGDETGSSEIHPTHTYPVNEGTDYEVRLIVASDFGCSDTAWKSIHVKFPYRLFVPNAFTPNADKDNPVFLPIVSEPFDITEYRLAIYNRWGGLVFSSDDIVQGWSGENAPADTYTWKLTLRNPYDKKQTVYTGRITLIR